MEPTAPPPESSPSKGRVFFTRLFSTVMLWTLVVLAIRWHNQATMVGIACFFGVAGALEYFRLLSRQGQQRGFGLLGLGICLCYWTGVLVHVLTEHTEPPLWYDLAALTAVVQGSFVLCYQHQLEGTLTLQRIFSTVFGVVYTVIFYGFLVRLMYFPGTAANFNGVFLMLYLIMVTKFSDMGAYAIGSLIGKHKMIEHISPKKTWEGFGGAMLGSLVAAAALLWCFAPHLIPLDWMHGLILVPILVCVGVSGDLAESVIKRCLAIKDTGHKLPGIGGILDLTDSLLFTAPVFYFYLVAFTK
jgi:phosphatidate cytidylyltransferase